MEFAPGNHLPRPLCGRRSPLFAFVRRSLRFAVPIVWGFGIVAALYSLEHYKSLAGKAAAGAPAALTADAASTPGKPRLVMYVHPHCPCTRASLAEFEQLVAGAKARGQELDFEVVVVVPPKMDPTWREGAIVRAAEQLVGVRVRTDLDAIEAREVGAFTSGHTLLVDAKGDVIFRGGITRSRGHAGDNAGTRALTELLHDRKPDVAATPVFGCPLFEPAACASIQACSASSAPKSVSQDSVPLTPGPSPARGEGSSQTLSDILSSLRIEPLPAVQD